LLVSYDRERRPVGVRNCEAAAHHTKVRGAIADILRADLDAPGDAGDRLRREAGDRIAALGNAENESFGIELGYAYLNSPIVCAEPDAQVPGNALDYVPSTVPGVRLPSVVLTDGTPIYDRLGPWFTLLCSGVPPSAALVAAAERRGMPLALLQLEPPDLQQVYGRGLTLVRPDQHVAWRGGGCDDPRAARAVVARCLGWSVG
jgi:hypothetical protein